MLGLPTAFASNVSTQSLESKAAPVDRVRCKNGHDLEATDSNQRLDCDLCGRIERLVSMCQQCRYALCTPCHSLMLASIKESSDPADCPMPSHSVGQAEFCLGLELALPPQLSVKMVAVAGPHLALLLDDGTMARCLLDVGLKNSINSTSSPSSLNLEWLPVPGISATAICATLSELIFLTTEGHLGSWQWSAQMPAVPHPICAEMGLAGESRGPISHIASSDLRVAVVIGCVSMITWTDQLLRRAVGELVTKPFEQPLHEYTTFRDDPIAALEVSLFQIAVRTVSGRWFSWGKSQGLPGVRKKLDEGLLPSSLKQIEPGSLVSLVAEPIGALAVRKDMQHGGRWEIGEHHNQSAIALDAL